MEVRAGLSDRTELMKVSAESRCPWFPVKLYSGLALGWKSFQHWTAASGTEFPGLGGGKEQQRTCKEEDRVNLNMRR